MESKLATACGYLDIAIKIVRAALDDIESRVFDDEDSEAYENMLDSLSYMYDAKDFLDNAFDP